MTTTNYRAEAMGDAVECIKHFIDEIVEHILRDGEASDDLNNDYSDGDSYHHQTHVDKAYSLTVAAQIIDELSDDVETDSGLWHGLEPRDAISCQAAFTYGNGVMRCWSRLISEINDNSLIEAIKELNNETAMDAELSAVCRKVIENILADHED